ncbi:MAG: tetratricopeptide repeat protein [bacterium]|nr:tetratricopeptide repeat protein [bacterium]
MNKRRVEEICTKIIGWTFLVTLFVVPLYFDTQIRGVFDVCKMTFLRISSLIIICVWLLRIILTKECKFIRSPLDLPVLAYLLVSITATIFSVDPFTSLVGAYKRHEGLTTTISYVLLFFTATNFLHNNRKLLHQVVYVGIGVGFIASLYALIQRAGRDPISWASDVTERAVSTFGNPIFLGSYLAMLIPVAMGYFFIKEQTQKIIIKKKDKKKKTMPRDVPDTIKVWLLGLGMIVMYISFFLAKSRGPFAGLLIGLMVFTVLIAILWRKKGFLENRKKIIVFGIGFFILTVFLSLQPGSLGERIFLSLKSAQEEKGEMLEKILTPPGVTSQHTDKSATSQSEENWLENKLIGAIGSRYFIWKNSSIIMIKYPQDGPIRGPLTFPYCGLVFGVGVDTMKWVYPAFELPGMELLEGANTDYDRAHNEVFDTAITRGLVGLAIYFWILAAFVFWAIKGYRQASSEADKLIITGFLSAWVTYIIQNQFAFAVISFTPFYWTLMGMTMVICGYTTQSCEKVKEDIHKKPSLPTQLTSAQICLSILVIGIVSILVYFSLLPYRADYYFNKGEKAIHDKDLDTALAMYEQAVKYDFRERHYYGELTYTYYKKADSIPMNQIELKKEWIRKAYNRVQDAFKVNPQDGYFYNILAATYALEYDTGSKTAKQKAIDAYYNGLKYNIVFAEPLNNLGVLYSKDKEYDKAIAVYKKVADMRPNDGNARVTVADMYFRKNDNENAIDWLRQAILTDPQSINAHHRLGEIYFNQGKFDESAKAFKEIVKIDLKNIDVHRDLGAAYFRDAEDKRMKGKNNEAFELYRQAKYEFELYLKYHPEDVGLRQIVDSIKI